MSALGLALGLALGSVSTASAQQSSTPAPVERPDGFDAQSFHPIAGPHGVYSTEGSSTLDHLRPAAGLVLNYGAEPILSTPEDPDDQVIAVVSQQLALHVQAGLGLTERLQLDASMPLYLVNDGFYGGEEITGFTTGDVSVRGKATALDLESSPVGFGVSLQAALPSGDEEAFTGGRGVVGTALLLVDGQLGPVYLAANLGARLQPDRVLRDVTLGHSALYRAGAEWRLFDGVIAFGGEIYGSTPLNQLFESRLSPLEGVLGIKLLTPAGFSVVSGAGGGLIGGIGAASFRSFIGLSYVKPLAKEPELEQTVLDADEDGFPDPIDGCPSEPEDADGFEDDDGCPDLDNDQDGLNDAVDSCPDEPGVEAQRGCPAPETDEDEDGILDSSDRCITEPGPEENQGCPWPDADADGVIEEGGPITGGEEVIEEGGPITGGEEVITGGEEVIEEGGLITGGEEVIDPD